MRLLHWNTAGENLLRIEYNECETGGLMVLGYHSHLSTCVDVSVSWYGDQM